MTDAPAPHAHLSIKKYPNRRFYDSTRSCHVTLEQIHQLILAGHEVTVTDSKTGRDITVNVLSQILLEMDSFKLAWLPNSLLHHIIRSNEPLVREFMEVYFNQAFEWFLHSRNTMEQQMRQLMGLGAVDAAAAPATEPAADLHERINRLTRSVEKMHSQFAASEPD